MAMPEVTGFATRYQNAVHDAQLGANLLAFQRGWREQRDARLGPGGELDFEALRTRLAQAKDAVLGEHNRYLEIFRGAAEHHGARVHVAKDAAQAVELVAHICRDAGATSLIKTKSMVSEEVHLNHRLSEHGIDAVETDVGEWIVQARHETPSHMVMPAIHLNRRQVAVTLEQVTGRVVSRENIAEQVATVRTVLRPRFLGARVGLTGANALIAETGSTLLVTNEGNEGLLTALADVHIVLAGWDKLVASTADAMMMVRLLARSATGQRITTYTTFVSGPAHPAQQLHYVIVDNGRSQMAADPELSSALRCIRCAACANVCPPYQVVGGHVFGHVYSGPIGLVTTPAHHGLAAIADAQALCVSCNACATVCPVSIPLPRQILAVRERVERDRGLRPLQRAALGLWRHPRLFAAAMSAAGLVSAPLQRHGVLRLPLPRHQAWRRPPAPAHRPAHRDIPTLTGPAQNGPLVHSGAAGTTAAYLIQCLSDWFTPGTATSATRLLSACGARVVVPAGQHCCGLPMFDAGDADHARLLARRTVDIFERTGADHVVTAATSCAVMIVEEYPHLLRGEPTWHERAQRLAARTYDLAGYLDRVARPATGALAAGAAAWCQATYHPFCQGRVLLNSDAAARRLLSDVCGIDLAPLHEADVCCGFGGATSLLAPEVGNGIVQRKLACVDATGARTLITDNTGCALHLAGAAHARGRGLHVAQLADVLASCLDATTQAGAGSRGTTTAGSTF